MQQLAQLARVSPSSGQRYSPAPPRLPGAPGGGVPVGEGTRVPVRPASEPLLGRVPVPLGATGGSLSPLGAASRPGSQAGPAARAPRGRRPKQEAASPAAPGRAGWPAPVALLPAAAASRDEVMDMIQAALDSSEMWGQPQQLPEPDVAALAAAGAVEGLHPAVAAFFQKVAVVTQQQQHQQQQHQQQHQQQQQRQQGRVPPGTDWEVDLRMAALMTQAGLGIKGLSEELEVRVLGAGRVMQVRSSGELDGLGGLRVVV